MDSPDSDSDDLPKSKYGTKEFWDTTYTEEIESFKEHGHHGLDVWFGISIAKRMIQYVVDHFPDRDDVSILDAGCGNGYTAFLLNSKGFKHILGVDYSEEAIRLCNVYMKENEVNQNDIKFEVVDILSDYSIDPKVDVFLDKGTYDALSLNPDMKQGDVTEGYVRFLENVLKPGGTFMITSCNWTKEELVTHFKSKYQFISQLETSSFTFGGSQGNRVTSLVFSKI